MATLLITEPTKEPVSLEETRTHLRVVNSAEDGLIQGYIYAARALVEHDTRRALMTQGWRLTIDYRWPESRDTSTLPRHIDGYPGSYPGGWGPGVGYTSPGGWKHRIVMPRPPLQTVDAINYVPLPSAANGFLLTPQLLDPSQYIVAPADTGEWYIEPAYNVVWPLISAQMSAVTVDFTCGYGDESKSIPEILRQAILMLVAQWFDYRVPLAQAGAITELPFGISAMIQRQRIMY